MFIPTFTILKILVLRRFTQFLVCINFFVLFIKFLIIVIIEPSLIGKLS